MTNNETSQITDKYAAFQSEDFSGIPSNEWYLQGPGEQKRSAVQANFLADSDGTDPEIVYTKVGTIDYRHLEQQYYSLLEEAVATNDDVFYEQVARKLAEMYRHQEIARHIGDYAINELYVAQQHTYKDQIASAIESGDDELRVQSEAKLSDLLGHKQTLRRNARGQAVDKAASLGRAERMNEEIFGEVTKEDFEVILAPYIAKAEKLKDTLPEAQELLNLVGDNWNRAPGNFDFAIKPETLALLKGDLLEIFPKLEDALAPHEDRKVGIDESMEWGDKLLAAVGLDELGWRTVKAPGKKSNEAVIRKRVIEYGTLRPEFSSTTAMNETNLHEAIGHGYRAMQGYAQEDPSLHAKMPGTDDFEESFATALQQLLSQKPRIAGQRYVLAYGLGKGLDQNGESRGFREMHDILYRTILVDNAAAGKPIDRQEAMKKAYQESSRIRRGGALDARDLSYFLGCKKSYGWMNEIAELPAQERQAKLKWVLSGRFDPTVPEQAEKFPVVA